MADASRASLGSWSLIRVYDTERVAAELIRTGIVDRSRDGGGRRCFCISGQVFQALVHQIYEREGCLEVGPGHMKVAQGAPALGYHIPLT